MTTVNEVIVTGRVKRRLIDKAAKLWQRLSYWTKASDVEFDDGKTAEEKVGNINGITSDIEDDSEDIAASSALTHETHERINELTDNGKIVSINIDDSGNPYIKYKDGADTVSKKLGNVELSDETINVILKSNGISQYNVYVTKKIKIAQEHIDNDYKFYVLNVSSAGSYYVAYSGINKNKSYFGNGAILVHSGTASGDTTDENHPGNGDLKTLTYIIPPQEIGTELKINITGIYSINIFGVK